MHELYSAKLYLDDARVRNRDALLVVQKQSIWIAWDHPRLRWNSRVGTGDWLTAVRLVRVRCFSRFAVRLEHVLHANNGTIFSQLVTSEKGPGCLTHVEGRGASCCCYRHVFCGFRTITTVFCDEFQHGFSAVFGRQLRKAKKKEEISCFT